MKTVYNLMIADDDSAIRKGLLKIVYDFFHGRKITIYEAKNGVEAWKLLSACTIDIIIVDIKMPICNGIELIKKMKARSLQTQIIVLSGFDDYNLVREALINGAADYLLKPVDIQAMNAQLERLVKAVDAQRLNLQTPVSRLHSDMIEQQVILEHLLHVSDSVPGQLQALLEKYNLSPEDPTLVCVVDFGSDLFSEMTSDLNRIAQGIAEVLGSNPVEVLQGVFGRFGLILIVTKLENPSLLQQIGTYLSTLELRFQLIYRLNYERLSKLKTFDKICSDLLTDQFYSLPYSASYDIPYEDHLETALNGAAEYDYTAFMQAFKLACASANHTRPSVEELRYVLSNWVHRLMIKNNAYISIIGNYQFTDHNILDVIENSNSLKILRDSILAIMQLYISDIDKNSSENEDHTIKKAKKYIGMHYDTNLMLSDVAAALYLSPNYFSALFKAKTGTTFRDYLINLRIEKAKELFGNTDLKVYEISHMVGYMETTHFNRAFKKIVGVSPASYKKHLG